MLTFEDKCRFSTFQFSGSEQKQKCIPKHTRATFAYANMLINYLSNLIKEVNKGNNKKVLTVVT